jgi:hypothetical protein
MGVLARDMYYYLSIHPRSDAKLFQDMIPSVIEEEKKERYDAGLWPDNRLPFPYDGSAIAVQKLPKGIVEAAVEGKIDISALYNDTIIHEWTSFTGRIFFRKFKSKFKEVICGKGGPYEQLNKGLMDKGAPATAIFVEVTKNQFSYDTFWIPILVYFAALLVKTGLKVYCEEG